MKDPGAAIPLIEGWIDSFHLCMSYVFAPLYVMWGKAILTLKFGQVYASLCFYIEKLEQTELKINKIISP